ncbi:putative metal-binding membrane protein [Hoeflea marina]|uniref:Putative metal-binding membrane protein n=1 Tax=Hoeflea marina TaxID=274592 RepID=A0A317PTW1_9HYPH|nr:DUF2182 domain-containing protein [Hoeflea marina]PWW04104.1 putative metal-binding membrane protein [Hoeflea marina]
MACQDGIQDPGDGRLDPSGPGVWRAAGVGAHSSWPALGVLAAAVLMAWWFLAAMAGAVAEAGGSAAALGPGMEVIALYLPAEPGSVAARLANLCLSAGDPQFIAAWPRPVRFLALCVMWMAMAMAMMLPMAAPMAGRPAAAAGGRDDAGLGALFAVAGYLAVWLLAAPAFAAVQYGVELASGQDAVVPLQGVAAGSILLGAGLYQFSRPRRICLDRCRGSMPARLAAAGAAPWHLFRTGTREAMWSLGCYWSLMLVVLVTGSMNVLWMLALTVFAFLEITGRGRVTSALGGTIVALWGAALVAGALVA